MTRLTIAIPTYNRPEALARTVSLLLPQLTSECKLLIVDNASTVPAAEAVKDVLAHNSNANATVHRNRFNVGMCGNFMRCFELCETEWLWILGDDDAPLPDAIEKIFRQLDSYPDCDYHNFVCPTLSAENHLGPRTANVVTTGVGEFIAAIDHFSSVQFISVNIFRAPLFTKFFDVGFDYGYSLHNFVAMILKVLGTDGKACFASDDLVLIRGRPGWSRIRHTLASCTLLELPLSPRDRECLAAKIPATFFRLKTTITILLDEIRSNKRSVDEARYVFHQICARAYYYHTSPGRRCRIALYRFLLRFPSCSTPLRKVPIVNKVLFNEKR